MRSPPAFALPESWPRECLGGTDAEGLRSRRVSGGHVKWSRSTDPSRTSLRFDWPFNTPITDLGEPLAGVERGHRTRRPGNEAAAVRDARRERCLRAARRLPSSERVASVGDFPDGASTPPHLASGPGKRIVLFFQAVMPDQSSCTDAY